MEGFLEIITPAAFFGENVSRHYVLLSRHIMEFQQPKRDSLDLSTLTVKLWYIKLLSVFFK